MSGPDPSELWSLIRDARWFSGKGRDGAVRASTELAALPGDPSVSIMVAEIGYVDAGTEVEYYLVPVIGSADTDGATVWTDATTDPSALAVIWRELLAAADRPVDPASPVRVHLVDRTGLSADLPGQRFGGEQSNTSIMYGGPDQAGAMLKVFRRLELGRNLDIEVHDVLGRSVGPAARDAAHLFGWVEGTWTTSHESLATADLAMLVERLTDVHDGYALAFEACRDGRSFAGEAAALGRALRNVHDVLATSFPTATTDGADTAALMRTRFDRAAAIAPALTPYADALGAVFDAVSAARISVQRIHGDFHLGQALVAGVGAAAGWKIIDFEGEPLKTLPERLAPDARVRDVAGALRSFDYAGTADPSPAGRAWVAECRAAFVDGWSLHAHDAASPGELALLRAYEADKAVYEVVYETRNRPDWVGIPLAGIRTLLDQHKPDQHKPDQHDDERQGRPDAPGQRGSEQGGTP